MSGRVLSFDAPIARFNCGTFQAIYLLDAVTKSVGLQLLPLSKLDAVVSPREYLETLEILALPGEALPYRASRGSASLVQIKLAEDDSGSGFGAGRSMRLSPTVEGLRFQSQTVSEFETGFKISTLLSGAREFSCLHVLTYEHGDDAISVSTTFTNVGSSVLTLEMLSSFSVGDISPFDSEDSAERLRVHRFRSSWSAEGRHEVRSTEELHLERSWSSHSVVNERFGQVGSMPVRVYSPFIAIEDIKENVFWGAQLACPGSWQMEVFRRDDKFSLSGGLADREFGHWIKRVEPGESITTPVAFLSTSTGSLDSFCQRLTRMHEAPLRAHPSVESTLPIVFNEWCSSWGWPTPEFIALTAERLRQTPVEIFVIDDGWAKKPVGAGQFNGDWEVETNRFPGGLKPVADDLRRLGFIPGLWFEFEVCTEGTKAFELQDHKLMRDGRVLKVGPRHFWDFTDPWTFSYLTEKVINRLREDGFGYLKVDYNDTIGLGCDSRDSLGEGLRLHLEGVQRFFRILRESIPDLIIEMCSSGGHRLEASMMSLASMGSFSDAHESLDIPIIAANLHRLILPRQSQIWAVLHATDTISRIRYSISACFLGRICLSGDITGLNEVQFSEVVKLLNFYQRVKHLIKDGESQIHRGMNESYRHPKGWQTVFRYSRTGRLECLVIIHSFEVINSVNFEIELPKHHAWVVAEEIASGIKTTITSDNILRCIVDDSFGSAILYLKAVE